jgi:hypothetical protein
LRYLCRRRHRFLSLAAHLHSIAHVRICIISAKVLNCIVQKRERLAR